MRNAAMACLVVLVLALPLPAGAQSASVQAPVLDLYGTFEAMGVIVDLVAADDPEGDATGGVEYRVSGQTAYRQGLGLSRVSPTRFAGSLFWLAPGTLYDVRVTFTDPSDGALDGVVLSHTGSTRTEASPPAPSQSYYASPAGGGSACSLAAPCSLTEGLERARAGDELVLRGGIYFQGEISLPRSGGGGAPLVIRGFPGESAILDGADPDTFAWTLLDGGVYSAAVHVADPRLVLAGGERLLPYQSLADLQSLIWDEPGFWADGDRVYVRLAANADPNGETVAVSRYNHALYVEQDHVHIKDLTFRHYGQGSYAKAIYLNNASDNLIQGCIFAHNDLGVGLKRDSHRTVIQDSEFYDTLFDWPWQAFYSGISLSSGGIRFYSPTTGRGTVIRRNTFHDYFDGFGACPGSTGGKTNETDVYDNLVYRAGDDGMETDGQCSNVRIWGNTFHDVLMGISLAPVYDGPVYALRNLIYRTGVGNNSYTGSPFKFNSGYDRSGAMYLFHNTSDAVLSGNNGLYIKAPGSWDLIYARNNIWSGTEYALNNYNEGQPLDADYDNLYTRRPGEFVYWGDGPDRHMRDLSTFQSLTGQEAHGLAEQPGFSEAGDGDYSLAETSPLIDAGQFIPGINDDFEGAAPDIGAFEYRPGYGFRLEARPPSQAIESGGTATYTLSVEPMGAFSSTVSLAAASLPPSLTLVLQPALVEPPGEAILTVTSPAALTGFDSGSWHTLQVTGTGGGFTQTAIMRLLVGGIRLYLPLVLR